MNKTQIKQKVLADFNQKRLEAEVKAKNNASFARKNNPQFAKLEQDKRALNLKLAQTNTVNERTKLENELIKLDDKLEKELIKLKLTFKDITPQYSCTECKDYGIVKRKMCNCLKKEINKRLLAYSGLKDFNGHTFKDVDETLFKNNKNLEKAHKIAKDYASKFPNVKIKNLIFLGEVGVGKTFLLECIANELISKDEFVVFSTAFNFSNAVINALTKSEAERQSLLSPFLDCDLLIIDDLGSEPLMKNLSINALFNIINERERKNKPYIISTNLNLTDLNERYGNRIFSRLSNQRTNAYIKLDGVDLRLKKN